MENVNKENLGKFMKMFRIWTRSELFDFVVHRDGRGIAETNIAEITRCIPICVFRVESNILP